VGSHFIGGLGIWDPYLAKVAGPASPVTVRDTSGVAYTITTNTVNNEALRHQVLGLSRARGARYSGNIGFAIYNSFRGNTLATAKSRPIFPGGLYFLKDYRQCQWLVQHGRVKRHSERSGRRQHPKRLQSVAGKQSPWRL